VESLPLGFMDVSPLSVRLLDVSPPRHFAWYFGLN